MEGQEYLNQISAKAKPAKTGGGLTSSKLFIFAIVAGILFVAMILFGIIFGGEKGGEEKTAIGLKLHLVYTEELIQEYQTSVRSSALRSSSASLYGLLSNIDREVTTYLVEKYKFKDKNYEKNVDKKIFVPATEAKEELETELFSAKINGILDRIYAHKMAYEISMFITEINKLVSETKNDTLKAALETSRLSLENLYSSFNDFSETKPEPEIKHDQE